ncbi:hypothetical protein BCF50_0936 [Chryseobacterium daecheongense]|uniref:Uncharacterized protein n=1 Tax=Chryseobacterium daecheongense TaxID=192389 RepID=A0ABY2G1M7_9FLAO|nr:hypothetical protein BCF50_0936 [Chryseobacterium daecheongense]
MCELIYEKYYGTNLFIAFLTKKYQIRYAYQKKQKSSD